MIVNYCGKTNLFTFCLCLDFPPLLERIGRTSKTRQISSTALTSSDTRNGQRIKKGSRTVLSPNLSSLGLAGDGRRVFLYVGRFNGHLKFGYKSSISNCRSAIQMPKLKCLEMTSLPFTRWVLVPSSNGRLLNTGAAGISLLLQFIAV